MPNGLAQRLLGLGPGFNPDTVLAASREQHLMPGAAARFALEGQNPQAPAPPPGLGGGGLSGGAGASGPLEGADMPASDGMATLPPDLPDAVGARDFVAYTVKPGDNLITIAKRVYGDPLKFRLLAQANGIKDPNMIRAGQRLMVPPGAGEA